MSILVLILLIAALVIFLIAAFEVAINRLNLVALGLACVTGALLVEALH